MSDPRFSMPTDDLVVLLHDIQAAAKQKYARTQTLRLQDYFISLPSVGSSSSSSSSGGGLIPPDTVADRAERDLIIGVITDRRMEIQFAADGAYPYTDSRNEEARRAFQLPLSRPFSG